MIASSSDKHFLHSSVVLRHANGDSGEAEHHIETILTEAAVHKRRVWVSSVLFAELRPSTFVPGRFATLFELTRYIRALATLVTPDPNAMLRVARLRDAKWHMPGDGREAEGKPRTMALGDAMQIASALWVKEAIGVPDLEFLTFDDWCSPDGKRQRSPLPAASPGLCGRRGEQRGRQGGDTPDAPRTGRPRAVLSRFGAGGIALAPSGQAPRGVSSFRAAPVPRR